MLQAVTAARPEGASGYRPEVHASRIPWAAVFVAALTCVGFVLRIRGINQSLYGDELATLGETWHHSLSGVVHAVSGPHSPEANPPLFFILAWASLKLGDPTVWVRLPSLVFGVLAIPLVYRLGLVTVGRRAALVGAALIALGPFAIFYSTEARAYETLMFFSAASTLALLKALDSRRVLWWAVYMLCVDATLYTHYSGIFVIGAQAAWAFWAYRQHWRVLLLVHATAAAIYYPWWHSFQGQSGRLDAFNSLDAWVRVTHQTPLQALLTWLDGMPLSALSYVPGALALIALGLGAAAGLLGRIKWTWGLRGGVHRASTPAARELSLVILLTVVTPIGVAIYDAFSGHALLAVPRNLTASIPCAVLLLGWLATPPGRVLRPVAIVLIFFAIGLGAVKTLDPSTNRPPFRAALQFVDSHARPGDRFALETKSYPLSLVYVASVPPYDTAHLTSFDAASPGDWIGPERRFFVLTFGCRPCTGEGRAAVGVGTPWRGAVPQTYHLVAMRDFPGVVRVEVAEYVGERLLPGVPVEVASTVPTAAAAAVAPTTAVTVVFDHAMNPSSAIALSLRPFGSRTLVQGAAFFLSDEELGFEPRTTLAYNARYTATISTRAVDVVGNHLARTTTWSFTTAGPHACPAATWASRSAPAQQSLKTVPGQVIGSIDATEIVGNIAEICGWAADVKDRRTAQEVLIFSDGRFVGAVRPTLSRPDIARALKGVGERSGFSVKLPLPAVEPGRKPATMELLGIAGGVASRLPIDCRVGVHEFGCR